MNTSPDWDEWYSETHSGTKATWEEDDEIPDYDKPEEEEE